MLKRLVVALLLGVGSPAIANDCFVSESQHEAAMRTDWQSFDQTGGEPGSFRELAKSRCWAQALEAYRAWIKYNDGFPDRRSQAIGMFHVGQALAFTGNREGAISMIERAHRADAIEGTATEDWNIYVDGVLAYFAGDAKRLEAARKRLASSEREFAREHAPKLRGLRRCIRKSYREAMSSDCRR